MKEVCIPFTGIKNDERAEVEVRIPKSNRIWKYRIEAFEFKYEKENETANEPITNLQNMINKYDSNWELIQIFDLDKTSGYVQLLYRYKK